MERGYSPKQPETSNFKMELHQVIRDGQNGLISFEDVRAKCRSLAISVLEQSEEGQKLLAFNLLLSSPEK